MNKIYIVMFYAILLTACGNSSTKKNHIEDTAKTEKNIVDQENTTKKLKHLFCANGGLIGFFDDGSVVGCPSCELIEENIIRLNEIDPYATYIEKENELIVNGNEVMELYEFGKIKRDWVILNYRKIKFSQSITNYQSYNGYINTDSVMTIKQTCLICIMPEPKHFDDEESEEAQDYFTAIDDLIYYLYETKSRFKDLHIQSIDTDKKYIIFSIENDEKIIVDTEQVQNGYSVCALLYKKGHLPIVIDITDTDLEEAKIYLNND